MSDEASPETPRRILRALVVSPLYPLQREPGLGVFLARELLDLAPHGFEFEILIPRPWAPWPVSRLGRWRDYGAENSPAGPAEFPASFVRYLRPPGPAFRRPASWHLSRRLRARVRGQHARRAYDLLLAVGVFPAAEACRPLADELDLPFAVLAIGSDVMTIDPRDRRLTRQLTDIATRMDLCIGVSEVLCARLRDAGVRNCLRVYLGRDTDLFQPAADRAAVRRELGWEPAGVVGTFVGVLWPAKGMGDLARVLADLLRESPQLRIACVGHGEMDRALKRAAESSGRPGGLILTGHVDPAEVPRYLRASDFLIFPSHSEGMPQAVLEAMSCGLPVIATRVGGIPEAVIDGETGILIDARAPDQLRAAIERMAGDSALRERAGRAGLERVRAHFDPAEQARRFAGALRDLVESRAE